MRLLTPLLAALAAAGMQQAAPPVRLETLRQAAQPLGAEPIEVLEAEKAWAGADVLLPLAAPPDAPVALRRAALRALGRLEDPRLVPELLALKEVPPGTRGDVIAASLKGFDPAVDPGLIDRATEWMFAIGAAPIGSRDRLGDVTAVAGPLSRIRFTGTDQVRRVEGMLVRIANYAASDSMLRPQYVAAARAFESLARINARTTTLGDETVVRIRKMAAGSSPNDVPAVRLHALLALIASRAVDADTLKAALADDDWQTRRTAVNALAGAAGGLDDDERLNAIQAALDDPSGQVRYEAVRAYARRGAAARGCAPIEAAIADADRHVGLAALDALGDLCKGDGELTDRIAALAAVPPAVGSWHRETHAFVALAKRAPERAAPSMEAFITHPVWWVRMYAAGAAAAAGDAIHLEKLVFDANDNVREAALPAWRRLKKGDAEAAILDALGRTDVQLVRTAAGLLKDARRSPAIYHALLESLRRLTAEGKETSRDARLPLLDGIAVQASAENAPDLLPLLKDFDPVVAERAAQVLIRLTGTVALPEPRPYRRGSPPQFSDLRQCVVVQLAGGGSFRMQMQPTLAPIAVEQFLTRATKDHYYDGLTIHRVVPNFVIQGGSPAANEYSGAKEFMRDEIAGSNTRGTVGLSTRGRNTGDAQFFVNLVDNPRLNGDYTVFALVPEADMAVVDRIQEGDVMSSINPARCPR